MPHGHCYLWNDQLVYLHVISDALIALAYFTIPFALIYLVNKRHDLAFNYIFFLFAIFILACGLTHVLAIYTVWQGAYWLSGGMKALTALASIATAMTVWPLIPKILALPSPHHLQNLNVQLAEQVKKKQHAVERAEEFSKLKSAFVANMSHELRTPLNAIMGYSQLLFTKESNDEKRKFLSTINTAGESLLTLINDVLDISKIEAGKLEIKYAEVSLKKLFVDMNNLFSQKAEEKGIDFIVDFPDNAPTRALLDGPRVRQILLNLCSNAVKCTSNGKVKISFQAKPATVNNKYGNRMNIAFVVEDTGFGISAQEQQEIFGAFIQAKHSTKQAIGGTGLGLAISLDLARAMEGDIKLTSTLGQGSCFTLELFDVDVFQQMPEQSAAVPSVKKINISAKDIDFQPATILVVDDIEFNRELLVSYLADWHFNIIEAENGQVALDKVELCLPDVILMDMKMPVMDGYQAVHHLKKNDKTKDITIIAVTASAMSEQESRIREVADDYIRKPVSQAELVTTLMDYLPHKKTKTKQAFITELPLEQQPILDATIVSDEQVEAFLQAISKGNVAEIQSLCREISAKSAEVGGYLTRLSEGYEYGTIIKYLNRT